MIEIKEEFDNFLKENKAHEKFYENFGNRIGSKNIMEHFEDRNTKETQSRIIGEAFMWYLTPERIKYWSKLEDNWISYLNNKKIEDKNA